MAASVQEAAIGIGPADVAGRELGAAVRSR